LLIAHISDTHLGYRQYNMDEREIDFYEAFEEAVDTILREHVKVVVHTGDLFENPRPPVKALYVAKEQFTKLRDRGVKVFAVMGDHDMPKRRGMPPHSLFTEQLITLGLTVDHEVVKDDGLEVFIAGLHHVPRRYREDLRLKLSQLASKASNYPKSLLALHQAVDKFLPFEYEVGFEDLPSSFTYIALGHLHRRAQAYRGRALVAYAGSLEITRRDEIEEWRKQGKGFYVVDLGGDEPTIHRVDLTSIRPQIEAEVDYLKLIDELKKLQAQVKNLPKKPILHLYVKGKNVDRRRVLEAVQLHMSQYLLSWRPEVVEEAEPERRLEVKAGLDWMELFKEAFEGDVELASLAYELFKHLKTGDEGVEEARKLTREFYEKRWKRASPQ